MCLEFLTTNKITWVKKTVKEEAVLFGFCVLFVCCGFLFCFGWFFFSQKQQ